MMNRVTVDLRALRSFVEATLYGRIRAFINFRSIYTHGGDTRTVRIIRRESLANLRKRPVIPSNTTHAVVYTSHVSLFFPSSYFVVLFLRVSRFSSLSSIFIFFLYRFCPSMALLNWRVLLPSSNFAIVEYTRTRSISCVHGRRYGVRGCERDRGARALKIIPRIISRTRQSRRRHRRVCGL